MLGCLGFAIAATSMAATLIGPVTPWPVLVILFALNGAEPP